MRTFDHSFPKTAGIPLEIVSCISAIEKYRGIPGTYREMCPWIFDDPVKVVRVQSVKASNAMEGIATTDRRIRSIVNDNTAQVGHDDEEIAGYRDAPDAVHRNFRNMDVKERDVLALHDIMLGIVDSPGRERFRAEDNVIMERLGRERRIRSPVPAADAPKAFKQMELAYMGARQYRDINRLLLTSCVVLDFLCIRPFMDGNGRMPRLPSPLLLYRSGYEVGTYVSFEKTVDENKVRYYSALKRSSEGWNSDSSHYRPFVYDFPQALRECHFMLAKRFRIARGMKLSKAERIEATIGGSPGPVSKRDIIETWPDISSRTAEAGLGRLQGEGKTRKVGSCKDARYVRGDGSGFRHNRKGRGVYRGILCRRRHGARRLAHHEGV